MSTETLKDLLEKLRWAEGLNPLPPESGGDSDGLWAVKWVQGGVAAGATRAVLNLRKASLEIELFGSVRLDVRRLAEQVVNGVEPLTAPERHLAMGLRHLRTLKLQPTLMSRDDHTKQLVTIREDGDLEMTKQRYEGGSGNLSVAVHLPKRPKPWATPWQPELSAMTHRLRYCPIPVLLGKESLSQRGSYDNPATLMNWMEPALGDEPYFNATGNPRQILSPYLVKEEQGREEMRRCGLLFALSTVKPGTGLAKVWWVKDGALVGPVRLVGPTGSVAIELICAGDRPGSLTEWAARDVWNFFPEKLVLSVAKRLAGGLDSLLPQLAAQEGFTGHLLRQANAATGFRNLFSTKGRPCLALSGPVHNSLKAFSIRSSLQLQTE